MNLLGVRDQMNCGEFGRWLGTLAIFVVLLLTQGCSQHDELIVLSIETSPQGALVTIDGEQRGGVTPLRNIEVLANPEGIYLVIQLEGYLTLDERLQLNELGEFDVVRRTLVPVAETPAPDLNPEVEGVSLSLDSQPPGASVCLGDPCESELRLPLVEHFLPEAMFPLKVRVSLRGHKPFNATWSLEDVKAEPNRSVPLKVKSPKQNDVDPPEEVPCWTLQVSSAPIGAGIVVRGRRVGSAPVSRKICGSGPVRVCANLKGYDRRCDDKKLTGRPGLRRMHFALSPTKETVTKPPPRTPFPELVTPTPTLRRQKDIPKDVTLQISSRPPGARVTGNGVDWGVTPLSHELSPVEGTILLIVMKDGFLPAEYKIDVSGEGGASIGKHFTLKEKVEVRKVEVGLLSVTSTPSGATIFIDGVNRGQSPIDGLSLELGSTIEVKAELNGFVPAVMSVEPEELRQGSTLSFVLEPEPVLPLDPKSCRGKEAQRWKADLKDGVRSSEDLEKLRACFATAKDWGGVQTANELLAQDPIHGRKSMTYYYRGATYLYWTGHENYQQCFQNLEKSLNLRSLSFCGRLNAQIWQIVCLDRLRTDLAFSELAKWPEPAAYLRDLDNNLGSEEVGDLTDSEFNCHKFAVSEVARLKKTFDSN